MKRYAYKIKDKNIFYNPATIGCSLKFGAEALSKRTCHLK
jgi:hypothetical protein